MHIESSGAPGTPTAMSAVAKANRRLLPFLALMFVLAFIDRVNVGFAREDLEIHAGISAAAYGLGAGIFFLGYALLEVPSNLLMHRIGARRWLARIMVTWGLVSASTAFVQGEISFYIIRILLGIAEAGFFPGVILYLTYWYPNRHRSSATGLFYWGLPLAFIIGAPWSGALLSIDSLFGLMGWQIMFLTQGLAASVVGVWAWFYLDDKPSDAKWLSKDEAGALEAWIASEEQERREERPMTALAALGNPLVLYFGLVYFLVNLTLYGVTFWLPATVGNISGLSSLAIGFVSALPWVFAAVGLFVLPRKAGPTGRHRQYAAACMVIAAIGLSIAASVGPVAAVAALCISAFGFIAVLPLFWNLPTSFLSGTAAAAGIALINSIGNLGSFTAPFLLGNIEERTGSIEMGLYILAGGALLCSVLLVLSKRRRKAPEANSPTPQDKGRVR